MTAADWEKALWECPQAGRKLALLAWADWLEEAGEDREAGALRRLAAVCPGFLPNESFLRPGYYTVDRSLLVYRHRLRARLDELPNELEFDNDGKNRYYKTLLAALVAVAEACETP